MRRILINGEDFTNRIELGYSFVEKLDRELDEGQFVIPFTFKRTPFAMWSKVLIIDNDKIVFQGAISADYVTLTGFSDRLFRHEISVIEPTKILETKIVKGKTFRQPTVEGFGTFYTLKDVVEVLRDTVPLQTVGELNSFDSKRLFILSDELADELDNIIAPEFTFKDVTLREALDEIANVVDGIARLDDRGRLYFDKFNEVKELFDVIPEKVSSEHDINNYATNIYTNALNSVSEGNEEVYPSKDLYTTLRSDGLLFDFGANGYIPTNKPIYKVNKVEVRQALQVSVGGSVTNITLDVPITDRVVEKTLWDSLDTSVITTSINEAELTSDSSFLKDNTFFFEYGKKNINVGQTFGLFDLRTTLEYVITISALPLLKELGLIPQEMNNSFGFSFQGVQYSVRTPITTDEALNQMLGVFGQAASGTGNLLCRVYYEPIPSSLSFDIHRDDYSEVNIDTELVGNQKLRIVDVNNYIKNTKSRVNRIGNSELQISHRVKTLDEAQNIGDFTLGANGRPEFIVTKREVIAEKDHFEINYGLNKNFNKISQFIGLNQEVRQWEVDKEARSIERSLVHTTFIEVDAVTTGEGSNKNYTLIKNDKILDTLDPNLSSNKPLSVLRAYADDDETLAVTAGINPTHGSNIISLSWEFDGNASAGFQKTTVFDVEGSGSTLFSRIQELIAGTLLPDRYYLIPTPYIFDDGKLENMRIQIAEDVDLEEPDRAEYLEYANEMPGAASWLTQDPHYDANFVVKKDSSERLLFNVQFNITPKEFGKVYIGENFAAKNMIFSDTPNNDIKIIGYEGVVLTERDKFSVSHLQGTVISSPNILIQKESNRIVIVDDLSSFDSYAIVDSNNIPFLLVNSNNNVITFDITTNKSTVDYLLFLKGPIFNIAKPTLNQTSAVYYEGTVTSVFFNTDGGSPQPETFLGTIGDSVPRPEVEPQKNGFIFLDWDVEFPFITTESSHIITAQYQEIVDLEKPTIETNSIYYDIPFGSVEFNTVGGTPIFPSVSGKFGDLVQNPGSPSRPGFVFLQWDETFPYEIDSTSKIITALYQEESTISKPTITTNSLYYEDIQLFLEFDMDGGTPQIESVVAPAGTVIDEPAEPTRAGFTFLGWDIAFPFTLNENTVTKAQWQETVDITKPTITQESSIYYQDAIAPGDLFDVNIDLNGGTLAFNVLDYIGLEPGSTVQSPGTPTKQGFIFLGWSVTFPFNMPANDVNVTALWQEIVNIQSPTINQEESFYYGVATTPPALLKTATPEVQVVEEGVNLVQFAITNKDTLQASVSYEVREDASSGEIIDNGTVSLAPNETTIVGGFAITTPKTFFLTGVSATALGKTLSDAAPIISGTTSTPITTYTVRAKSESPQTTGNIPMLWEILAPGYEQSGQTNINSTTFTNLRTDAPENSSLTAQASSSFVFNGVTYTFVRWRINGVDQTIGEELIDNFQVTSNTDIIAVYGAFGF